MANRTSWQSQSPRVALTGSTYRSGTTSVTSATYEANQLKNTSSGASVPGGAPTRFFGTLSEPATVTVSSGTASTTAEVTRREAPISGTTAKVSTEFEAYLPLTDGTKTVTITATAPKLTGSSGTTKTTSKTYTTIVKSGTGTKSFTYDSLGSTTGDSASTYEWDPLGRIAAINVFVSNTTYRTEFAYDGMGRRVRQQERTGVVFGKCHGFRF